MLCNYLKNFLLEIHRVSKLATSFLVNVLVQTENNEISRNLMYILIMLHFIKKTPRVLQITMEEQNRIIFTPPVYFTVRKKNKMSTRHNPTRTLNRIRGRWEKVVCSCIDSGLWICNVKLMRVPSRRLDGQFKESEGEGEIHGGWDERYRVRIEAAVVVPAEGGVNEHSLFGDERCGCRLSQPHHPVHELEEKGSRGGVER